MVKTFFLGQAKCPRTTKTKKCRIIHIFSTIIYNITNLIIKFFYCFCIYKLPFYLKSWYFLKILKMTYFYLYKYKIQLILFCINFTRVFLTFSIFCRYIFMYQVNCFYELLNIPYIYIKILLTDQL